MKTGETSTVIHDEEVSAEILCLRTRKLALRKAIVLRDAASQVEEDAEGEMEKSAATQKLETSERFVALTLKRVEDTTAWLVERGVDVEQLDGVELLSAGPSPVVSVGPSPAGSPSKRLGREPTSYGGDVPHDDLIRLRRNLEKMLARPSPVVYIRPTPAASPPKLLSAEMEPTTTSDLIDTLRRQIKTLDDKPNTFLGPHAEQPKVSLIQRRAIASLVKAIPTTTPSIPSGSKPADSLRQLGAQIQGLLSTWGMTFLRLPGTERLQAIVEIIFDHTSEQHDIGLAYDKIDGLARRVCNTPTSEKNSNIVRAAIEFGNTCDTNAYVIVSAWATPGGPLATLLENACLANEARRLAFISSGTMDIHMSSIMFSMMQRLELEAKPTILTTEQLFDAEERFKATMIDLSQGFKAGVMAYHAEFTALEQRFKINKTPFNLDAQIIKIFMKALPPGVFSKEVNDLVKLIRLAESVIGNDDFFRRVESLAYTLDQREMGQKERSGSDRGGAAASTRAPETKIVPQPARAQANAVAIVADTRICWLCQQPGHIKPNCPSLAVQGNGQAPQRARGSGL